MSISPPKGKTKIISTFGSGGYMIYDPLSGRHTFFDGFCVMLYTGHSAMHDLNIDWYLIKIGCWWCFMFGPSSPGIDMPFAMATRFYDAGCSQFPGSVSNHIPTSTDSRSRGHGFTTGKFTLVMFLQIELGIIYPSLYPQRGKVETRRWLNLLAAWESSPIWWGEHKTCWALPTHFSLNRPGLLFAGKTCPKKAKEFS